VRLTAPRAVLNDRHDTVQLAADGKVYTFAPQARPALRALLDGAAHSLSALTAASGNSKPETIHALCEALMHTGIVAIHTTDPQSEAAT
jgi:hypothetical protein